MDLCSKMIEYFYPILNFEIVCNLTIDLRNMYISTAIHVKDDNHDNLDDIHVKELL